MSSAAQSDAGADGSEQPRYQLLDMIGEGTYGRVFRARDTVSHETLAIKEIDIDPVSDYGVPVTALREVGLLKSLKHPNVVPLREALFHENKLRLVFDYFPQDLHAFIKGYPSSRPLDRSLIKSMMHQILSGLCYCHEHNVVHRDIKPHNILLGFHGEVKLADFGLARTFSTPQKPYTNEVVTLWYRAPEVLLGAIEYSTPVDVWSVGCIFAELFNRGPLFNGSIEADQMKKIFRVLGAPDPALYGRVERAALESFLRRYHTFQKRPLSSVLTHMDEAALDLVEKMLVLDPAKRISCRAALQHPYFVGSPVKSPLGARTADAAAAGAPDASARDAKRSVSAPVDAPEASPPARAARAGKRAS